MPEPGGERGEGIQPEDILAAIARALWAKKGSDVLALDVSDLVYYTDYFVICSGRSDVHVKALMRHVDKELSRVGVQPLSVEGEEHCRWVLMDYGPVMVHIFYEPLRELYELEKLWSDAVRVELPGPGKTPEPEESEYLMEDLE